MEYETIHPDLLFLYQECICCVHFIQDICFTCTKCDNFKLCLQCFVSQIELGNHKATHPFNYTDLATFTLFSINQSSKSQFKSEVSSSQELAIKRSRKSKRQKTEHPVSFEYQMDFNYMGFLQVKVVDRTQTAISRIPYLWRACDERELLNVIQFKHWGNWEAIQKELKNRNVNVSLCEIIEHYNIHYVLTDVGPDSLHWQQYTSRLIATLEYAAKKN